MNEHVSIVPHLWFNSQAAEAAEFYCSLFPQSKIGAKSVIHGTPAGDCDCIPFELWGRPFEAINGGPGLSINPSISFMVNFDSAFFQDAKDPSTEARNRLNELWTRLINGGKALMELGKYDFAPLYGWLQDKYGVTWQLILTEAEGGDPRPTIMPSLLFVGKNWGKAEAAGNFYRSVFPSTMGINFKYPAGMEPEKEGTIMFSDFQLGDTWITVGESAHDHQFQFNEAISFRVYCNDQQEVDYYRDRLSAIPEAEQYGWLKDTYGISWQVTVKK